VADLVAKIVAVHKALRRHNLAHAFGGALALAWCTARARGTIDIDVNVFVASATFQLVLDALPRGVSATKAQVATLRRDGQVRLWWDKTPLDLFLNTTDLHVAISERIRWEAFAGESLPFLSCRDIAVFKALFNRTKDWADLEEMHAAGTLDIAWVRATIADYVGAGDDERLQRLDALRRRR
jgi:hypothetical protein